MLSEESVIGGPVDKLSVASPGAVSFTAASGAYLGSIIRAQAGSFSTGRAVP